MDIDSIHAFLAVAKHQSFSIAAQHLHITQPAVSKRIGSLEQTLNHSLFNRSAKNITLTEAGENLLPRAQLIVQTIEDTQNSLANLSNEVSGSLKMATSHHIGLHHLPPILRTFASKHPQVNLRIEFLDSEVAHNKVLNGECDLAVVTLAPNKTDGNISSQPIWTDPLYFVAAKSHSLFKQKQLSLESLSQTPAILPDLNTYTGRIAKRFFDSKKLPITLNMTTNYLETIKMMVSVGLGWSLLPATLIDDNVQKISVTEQNLSRTLGVITNKKRVLSNAARAFYTILCTETQKQGINKDTNTIKR